MQSKLEAVSGGTGKLSERFNKVGGSVDGLRRKLINLGDRYSIKVDSSELDNAQKKANSLLSSFKGGLGRGIIGGVIGGILGNLGIEGIQGIGRSTLGAALGSSDTRFRLTELMGSSGAYNRLEKQIDTYAPERRDQLLSSAAKLSGSGVTESALMPTLRMLNNISALTGQSVEEMALIQSKIKSTGYVQGDEINMYKERGINLNPYIASQMGVNELEIAKLQSKGLITYDILDKAMQKYAGTGGKFDNVYEKRRDSTPLGRYEYLSGRIQTRFREFGNDTMLPLFNKGLDFANQLFEKIGPLDKAFGSFKEGFGAFGKGVYDVLTKLGIFSSQASLAENIVNTLAFGVRTAGSVFEKAGIVISWFSESPIAQLSAGLFGVWRLLPLLDKAWIGLNKTILMSPIGLAGATFVALGGSIWYAYERFEKFRYAILDGWEGLKVFFGGLGQAMQYIVTGNWLGLATLSNAMDIEAQKNGNMAILNDKRERSGHNDRARQRGINVDQQRYQREQDKAGAIGFGGFAKDGGLGGSVGSINPGLSSSVGNSASKVVNISFKSLIEKSEIHITNMDGNIDMSEFESRVIESLMRVVNSGARIAF